MVHVQVRRHEVLNGGGGDGLGCVNPTYPQILISPRISVALFENYWKIYKDYYVGT